MENFKTILVNKNQDGIVYLKLNRIEKHHAINSEMISEITNTINLLSNDKSFKALIISSSGPNFCSGGDLMWMKKQFLSDRKNKIKEAKRLSEMFCKINELNKPVISVVQGNVYGGGLGILCCSDIVIAEENVKFCLTETSLGLIPATIGPFVIQRVGEGNARQLFFTGSEINVKRAMSIGLISYYTKNASIDNLLNAEIRNILKASYIAISEAKSLCLRLGNKPTNKDIEYSINALANSWENKETQERIKKFLKNNNI